MNSQSNNPYFAAVDLGSNSFHLLIAKISDSSFDIVDRVKEMVQIAQGLKHNNTLSEEAQERALRCLERFHERIRDIPACHVRTAGTKALRTANNASQFLKKAESALGHPINIISGYEEARLVYLGVSHDVSDDKGQRLVVDIGGGSTEFIIGKGEETFLMESLSLGCVTYTDQYLSTNGKIPDVVSPALIWNAYYSACSEIEPICHSYRHRGWDIAVGSSGTMKAIAALMQDGVVSGVITRKGINRLVHYLHQEGTLDGLIKVDRIAAPRKSVLMAGIIIVSAIFDQFKLEEIHVVESALKEGLIYDTLGRLGTGDIRDQTTHKMMQQYQVDAKQSLRVETTLLHFSKQLPTPVVNGASVEKILHWAAQLHEIGLSISHSGYHHHGHYVIQQSDMAGFSRFEQELLALLVGSHRRKIRPERLMVFTNQNQKMLHPLLACLRLSVLLNHRREDGIKLPDVTICRNDDENMHMYLTFPEGWLTEHPLTSHRLGQEAVYLAPLNTILHFQ